MLQVVESISLLLVVVSWFLLCCWKEKKNSADGGDSNDETSQLLEQGVVARVDASGVRSKTEDNLDQGRMESPHNYDAGVSFKMGAEGEEATGVGYGATD